jgi:hypothetical protein
VGGRQRRHRGRLPPPPPYLGIFAAHRPNAPEKELILAEPLNAKPKYVASRTPTEPPAWQNFRSPSAAARVSSAMTVSSVDAALWRGLASGGCAVHDEVLDASSGG